MKRLLVMLLLVALQVPALAQAGETDNIDRSTFPRLRWMGTGKPGTYHEYMRSHPPTPCRIQDRTPRAYPGATEQLHAVTPLPERPVIALVVNAAVHAAMEEYIRAYADILANINYQARVFTIEGGTHQSIRSLLRGLGKNLAGAVLIGPMPAAWYEIADDYGDGEPAEFPCDLYYMDLDGNWIDSDNNGRYDSHKDGSGDRAPEIFVARIDSCQHGDDSPFPRLQDYFIRDLGYWNGDISLISYGLTYTEDDWTGYPDMTGALSPLYGNAYDAVIAPATNRNDYQARLADPVYDLIQLHCHSDSHSHHFTRGGQLFYHQVQEAPPAALFFNLFACSSLRFTEPNHLGGAYLFNDSARTLAVIGSTKTGSMLGFYPFYRRVAENRPVGEAFLKWFQDLAPYDFWDECWHYGMCLLGDPMISLVKIPGNLYAPHNFRAVKVANKSMLITEWLVELSWEANPESPAPPAGYRLYQLRESSLQPLADLAAATTSFRIRRVDRDAAYVTALTAVGPDGRESIPVFARVE